MSGFFNRLANVWTFLGLFCICYFLETIIFNYLGNAISSIERQFQIPSKISGNLAIANEIGFVIAVVFLAYFGGKRNRGRWIGAGIFTIAAACVVIALPCLVSPKLPDPTLDVEFLMQNVTVADLMKAKNLRERTQPSTEKILAQAIGDELESWFFGDDDDVCILSNIFSFSIIFQFDENSSFFVTQNFPYKISVKLFSSPIKV